MTLTASTTTSLTPTDVGSLYNHPLTDASPPRYHPVVPESQDAEAAPAAPAPPPAYTPHTLPPYTHFDRQADRQNYAISLLMHNLRFETSDTRFPPLALSSPSTSPALSPSHNPAYTQGQGQGGDMRRRGGEMERIHRAAVRDHRDTQDPTLWGSRTSQTRRRRQDGRGAEAPRGGGGVWSWLVDLFVVDLDNEDDRARYNAGIPIWITPNGAI